MSLPAELKPQEISPRSLAPDIRVSAPERPLVDVMQGAARWDIQVHEHGFVALVDAMPRLVPRARPATTP